MQNEGGIGQALGALPVAHKAVLGIAGAILAMAAFLFFQWVGQPSYALLFAGLDDTELSSVVDELDKLGVPYQLEAGGSRVLVPAAQVHSARADLASAGVRPDGGAQGFELLDEAGINASDFRQRIDYQRALEGELARMLSEMDGIQGATVHLVLPEETLFAEDRQDVTASVLLTPSRSLTAIEVETVTFLVASAVEGMEPGGVTVADVSGDVLHASGELAGNSAVTNRNMRMTRDFERALAFDVTRLLDSALGSNLATTVVRADLDFDESTTETETYDPDSTVILRQQTIDETFTGTGTPPAGTAGVDGAPATGELDEYDYTRAEATRESGVDRTITRTIKAPGKILSLSVAVVMDDGSLTGAVVPTETEVQELLTAAMGIDATRGDTIAVTSVPFPAPAEVDPDAELAPTAAAGGSNDMIPTAVGAAVLLIVAVALFMMTRKGKRPEPTAAPAALPAGGTILPGREPALIGAQQSDVVGMIETQPEEIAVLLRSWLADRR